MCLVNRTGFSFEMMNYSLLYDADGCDPGTPEMGRPGQRRKPSPRLMGTSVRMMRNLWGFFGCEVLLKRTVYGESRFVR